MSNFLIEIFTEELPPTALKKLSTSLAELSLNFLGKDKLIGAEPSYKAVSYTHLTLPTKA